MDRVCVCVWGGGGSDSDQAQSTITRKDRAAYGLCACPRSCLARQQVPSPKQHGCSAGAAVAVVGPQHRAPVRSPSGLPLGAIRNHTIPSKLRSGSAPLRTILAGSRPLLSCCPAAGRLLTKQSWQARVSVGFHRRSVCLARLFRGCGVVNVVEWCVCRRRRRLYTINSHSEVIRSHG